MHSLVHAYENNITRENCDDSWIIDLTHDSRASSLLNMCLQFDKCSTVVHTHTHILNSSQGDFIWILFMLLHNFAGILMIDGSAFMVFDVVFGITVGMLLFFFVSVWVCVCVFCIYANNKIDGCYCTLLKFNRICIDSIAMEFYCKVSSFFLSLFLSFYSIWNSVNWNCSQNELW